MSEIYLITAEQTLVPLAQEDYASENLLQTLLENYPSLLAGDQINPETPRRWLLVKREAAVPGEEDGAGRWSLDHLFLDQDGVPTLVEVKRSKDTRIRREVVGQMLDYAANGVKYWPIDALRSHFEQTCENAGTNPEEKVQELIGSAGNQDQFWITVKTNLQAGRIRMLFVADEIPEELRRVVEFLNEQMDPAEVLAIEIRQFSGQSLKTLVPRVIGQTSEAGDRKRVSGGRAKRQWDEPSYFAEMEARHGPEASRIARRLVDWGRAKMMRIWWGQGLQNGSFVPVLDQGGLSYQPFSVFHDGARGKPCIDINFQFCLKKPPFDDRKNRLVWLQRINEIPNVSLSDDALERRPNFPLLALASEDAMNRFLSAMDWFVSEAVKTTTSTQ
jgi:hypothetical protein